MHNCAIFTVLENGLETRSSFIVGTIHHPANFVNVKGLLTSIGWVIKILLNFLINCFSVTTRTAPMNWLGGASIPILADFNSFV